MPEEQRTQKVALIGFGYWGSKIARVFHESKDFELAVIVESDKKKHPLIKKKYPTVEIWDNILNDDFIDIYAVVTPPSTHFEFCKTVLNYGKHVWVTKPFVLSSDEAKELYALAKQQNKTIFVDYTFAFHDGIIELKKQLPKVGKIRNITSQRLGWGLYSTEVSVIEDLMPHDLSVLHFLFDDKKGYVSIDNVIKNENYIFNDSVYLRGWLKNNIKLEIINSWSSPVKIRLLTIVGDKGALVFDDMQAEKIKFYDKTVKYKNGKFIYTEGPTITFPLDGKEALIKELEEYSLFLNDKKKQSYYNNMNMKVVKDLERINLWSPTNE